MASAETGSRIHVGLLDLHGGLGRVDGGVGFALKSPGVKLRVSEGKYSPLDKETDEVIERVCRGLGVDKDFRFEVLEKIPGHVGLGSKTQFSLAAASAVAVFFGIKKTVRELAVLTGRGGTSGIGVAVFKNGGFVLDGGHSSREKPEFLPSRASKAKPAPVLARLDVPENWRFVCVVPRGEKVFGGKEVDIFKTKCPIPASEVEKACRIVLLKMLPALAEKDAESFGESIGLFQETGFKKIEVSLRPKSQEYFSLLKSCGCLGAGMSSFGPLYYGLVEGKNESENILEKIRTESDAEVFVSEPKNSGAVVR